MINISKLYCDQITPGDWLRYGRKGSGEHSGEAVPAKASERRPIVVWNITRTCNLRCVHCYNDSGLEKPCNEITTAKAKEVIDDLAAFDVPSILFSGGEPLMRPDLLELIEYAVGKGLRTVISTNGTLIARTWPGRSSGSGFLRGDQSRWHRPDQRQIPGCSRSIRMGGARHPPLPGGRRAIGLRLTLTKRNVQDWRASSTSLRPRASSGLLLPSGPQWPGGEHCGEDLTHAQTRAALDRILAKTRRFKESPQDGYPDRGQHVDGVYLYVKLLPRVAPGGEDWKLLTWNGGGLYSSGVGIGCIDYNGRVHPDQFWWHTTWQHPREAFSEILTIPTSRCSRACVTVARTSRAAAAYAASSTLAAAAFVSGRTATRATLGLPIQPVT
jgi:MoaA/NifB/PqqE/SkfB family radical SAM enzyme